MHQLRQCRFEYKTFSSLKYVSSWFGDCCRLSIVFQSKWLSFVHDMNSSTVGILHLICASLRSFSAEDNTSTLSCFTNFTNVSYIELIIVVFWTAGISVIGMLLCIITLLNNSAEICIRLSIIFLELWGKSIVLRWT